MFFSSVNCSYSRAVLTVHTVVDRRDAGLIGHLLNTESVHAITVTGPDCNGFSTLLRSESQIKGTRNEKRRNRSLG